MVDVLLATSSAWPRGEPAAEVLDAALAEAGVDAAWARWDDEAVDWAAARLVCVRSTWDYQHRLAEFLAWADAVGPALLHGAGAIRWNTDKRYLLDLAPLVPVVPTVLAGSPAEVRGAVAALGEAVVKPRVGASGHGLVVMDAAGTPAGDGPWIVQPVLGSVHTTGEQSVYVVDGVAVSQVRKVAGPGDVRVHEYHGGASYAVPLDPAAAELAVAAFRATASVLGVDLAYVRADLLALDDGTLAVGEVELTEPGLYLDVDPTPARPFAEALARRLG